MLKYRLIYVSLLSILLLQPSHAAKTTVLQNEEIRVVYPEHLKGAAQEVLEIYPGLRNELQALFNWIFFGKPQVVLVPDRQMFQQMTGNNLFVAFAVPEKNRVVIDYSKMHTRPFTLSITLKHELCHLLLHQHISRERLPKWLDEGVCQWVSDGIAEILLNPNQSILKNRQMSGRYLRLASLHTRFPRNKTALMLAYEQSKSLVEFINRRYGKQAIIDILKNMEQGLDTASAISSRLSISMDELEQQWADHLKDRTYWWAFLASHMYAILFFLAAVITVLGFIRFVIRKRAYRDADECDHAYEEEKEDF